MFFQIDDQLPVNAKVRRVIEDSMTGELAGLASMGIWTLAGASSQASLTDGMISRADLLRIVLNPALADHLAELLVSAKLWHPRGHDCPRCPQPGESSHAADWVFHDWSALGYSSAEQVKVQRAKAKELKDPALIAQVWARDCADPTDPTSGPCRYCGVQVKRKTTVGDARPEMDHVDPNKVFGVRNVVLSCKKCNSAKGRRTPEQAGMTLSPPPVRPPARTLEQAGMTLSPPPVRPLAPTTPETLHGTTHGTRAGTSPGTSVVGPLVDQAPKVSRARDAGGPAPGRVRAGVGLGEGVGEGAEQGAGEGASGSPVSGSAGGVGPARPQPSRSSRRRGRRRDREPQQQPPSERSHQPEPGMDAGAQDPVPTPGRFGSPWHGWTGPRSSVTETTCTDHDLEQPCPKCPDGDL